MHDNLKVKIITKKSVIMQIAFHTCGKSKHFRVMLNWVFIQIFAQCVFQENEHYPSLICNADIGIPIKQFLMKNRPVYIRDSTLIKVGILCF